MNEEAQERLDKILQKDPNNLTKEEIGFLRARRSYLKAIQLEEYASILENQTSKTETVKKSNAKSK